MESLTSERPTPFSPQLYLPSTGLNTGQPNPHNDIQASYANYGQLNEQQNEELVVMLDWSIRRDLFPLIQNACDSI